MTLKEKLLYHQIHPLKIAVDTTTSIISAFYAWQHSVTGFLLVFLIPSVIVTLLLLRFADIERLKNSVFGRYVGLFMTKTIEAIRFAGQIIIWVAAWYHLPILILAGIVVIVAGWFNGKLFKRERQAD